MSKILNFLKNRKSYVLITYLVINSLFILKYSKRQDYISSYLILAIYIFFILFTINTLSKFSNQLDRFKKFNSFYILGIILVSIIFIFINYKIDGNSLNTDRWSALEVTIKSLLNGVYPYNVKDHLGKTTSNLPALFYIGLPFYLIGEIGLLQVFVFVIGCLYILRLNISHTEKLLIVLLFLLSPAYHWEIFAKSDLMSNMLLLVIFIHYWGARYKNNLFQKPVLLAFFCTFLILTRGIVIVPLLVFLFKDFIKVSLSSKGVFIVSGFVFLIIISTPVLITLPDYQTIIKHNPFNHQTRYTPKILQLIVVITSFFLSLRTKSVFDVFYFTYTLLTVFLFSSFLLNIYQEGFYENLYNSLFDISYLSMILPFAIPILSKSNKKFIMRA